jgi:putative ABC transport system permease protein
LSKEFFKWVLTANLIAWPAAYIFMTRWLQHYAYRVGINVWIFLLSGAMALIIAVLSVGYQSLRAALSNPVKVLKYE